MELYDLRAPQVVAECNRLTRLRHCFGSWPRRKGVTNGHIYPSPPPSRHIDCIVSGWCVLFFIPYDCSVTCYLFYAFYRTSAAAPSARPFVPFICRTNSPLFCLHIFACFCSGAFSPSLSFPRRARTHAYQRMAIAAIPPSPMVRVNRMVVVCRFISITINTNTPSPAALSSDMLPTGRDGCEYTPVGTTNRRIRERNPEVEPRALSRSLLMGRNQKRERNFNADCGIFLSSSPNGPALMAVRLRECKLS